MNESIQKTPAPTYAPQAPARGPVSRAPVNEVRAPTSAPHPPASATAGPRVRKIHFVVRIAVTTMLVIAAAMLGIWAFRYYEFSPWTRDGRISAYVVDSAAEISGQVVEVAVRDNQTVKKGDLLYRIDPRDYEAAVRKAQANVAQAEAELALARTGVPMAEANHHFQVFELARIRNLTHQDNAAEFELNQAQRDFDITSAKLAQAKTTVGSREADLEAAKAALYKARIDLERCEVRSSVNGWVTNLTVRIGDYAVAGKSQMSLVDADSFWITGYFEETRLRHVHVGASAKAVLMGYSDVELAGHVESINRGIADSNLAPNQQGLPQVSPVFTWVRLAQRIPVRIHIDHVPEGVHIAIGETCTINVEHSRQ